MCIVKYVIVGGEGDDYDRYEKIHVSWLAAGVEAVVDASC